MAQMTVGLHGPHLEARVQRQAVILDHAYRPLIDRRAERRPATAGIEFVGREEQRFAADSIHIDAGVEQTIIFVMERRFGGRLLRDRILQMRSI